MFAFSPFMLSPKHSPSSYAFPFSKLFCLLLCFTVIYCSSNHTSDITINSRSNVLKNEPPSKSLIDVLLRNYDTDARPVIHNEDPLDVGLGMNVHQIVEMNVKTQILTLYVWISLEWTDVFLRWNPQDFNNVSDIRLPTTRVWIPDLELYNGADELVSLSDGRTPLVVKHNGSVSWIEPKEFRSFCPVDITYFPFDEQTCKVKIGSWSHDGFQLNLQQGKHDVHVHDTASMGKWTVINGDMERSSKFYSCCPEPYVDMTLTLLLKRKPMHYVCDTIIPCVLLSVVAIVTLTMSPECWMRLAMQVLIFFGFAFYVWDTTGLLPYLTNSTSIYLVYLMLMMVHAFLAIVFTILILKLYNIGKESNTRPLPNWLKFILLSDKNTLLKTMNIIKRKNDHSNSGAPYGDLNNTVRDDIPLTQCAFADQVTNQQEISMPNNIGAASTVSTDMTVRQAEELRQQQALDFGERYSVAPPVFNNALSVIVKNSEGIQQASSCRQSTSADHNYGIPISHDDEQRKRESLMSAEWTLLAQKMDGICFWIITVTTILINFLLFILTIM